MDKMKNNQKSFVEHVQESSVNTNNILKANRSMPKFWFTSAAMKAKVLTPV